MKTKIIYISGGEVFNMDEIRAAFDQVRDVLNLGSDTVMFGVPVDKGDALSDNQTNNDIQLENVISDDIQSVANIDDVVRPAFDFMTESDISETDTVQAEPVAEMPVTETIEPVKKSRGRPKKATTIAKESVNESDTQPDDQPEQTENKVISILSVLTSKNDTDTAESDDASDEIDSNAAADSDNAEFADETDSQDMPTDADAESEEYSESDEEYTDTAADNTDDTATQISASEYMVVSATEIIESNANLSETDNTDTPESVHDMISDEEPTSPIEHTLEQLLESMTPLREDIEHEHMDDGQPFDDTVNTADDDMVDDSGLDIAPDSLSDADATLEKLANEFAEHEQDIATPAPRSTSHGKIGKLKNILPFKKAKHDDTGLMGDLFGWAGIAANDEDFAIPGFFTNAASNK